MSLLKKFYLAKKKEYAIIFNTRYVIQSHLSIWGEESHTNPNCHSEPLPTAPRIKRVHSNSNRKNTFSDYEFSIFTPVLNFFHAHRVSAKELRSKSLNLFAIRHECRTEIRSALLAEESHIREKSSLTRDISLSLNMTEYFSHSVFDTESVSLMFLS